MDIFYLWLFTNMLQSKSDCYILHVTSHSEEEPPPTKTMTSYKDTGKHETGKTVNRPNEESEV